MSSATEPRTEKLTFRRFREGDTKWKSWRDQIFQASYTHKCPTYIQSTPPCQGSCPSGEDIRGYLNIARSSLRLLETIASATSVALENACLFDETQRLLNETKRRAAELEILNDIGQVLTQQLDVNTIIEKVGDKVCELVKEDNIGIGLYDLETNTVTAHYVTKGKERIQYPPFPINLFTQKAALQGKTLIINRRSPILSKKLGSNMTAANEIPQSVVMSPMIVGKEFIGGFTVQNFERRERLR